MRRTVWVVPGLALVVTLLALTVPGPGNGDSGLRGVFSGPQQAEAALRRISIPFGFESVELRHNSRQVDTTGRIHCDPGDRFRVKVSIVQETSEGDVEGFGHANGQCTGDPQDWSVRVVARGPNSFESGEAVGIWTFETYRGDTLTDSETNADDPAVLRLGDTPPVD